MSFSTFVFPHFRAKPYTRPNGAVIKIYYNLKQCVADSITATGTRSSISAAYYPSATTSRPWTLTFSLSLCQRPGQLGSRLWPSRLSIETTTTHSHKAIVSFACTLTTASLWLTNYSGKGRNLNWVPFPRRGFLTLMQLMHFSPNP